MWTKIGDNYYEEMALLDLSRSATMLDGELMCYSNRVLTDGFVPTKALPRLTTSGDPSGDMAQLVEAGVWSEVEGGWQRVQWAGDNGDQLTKAEVEERKADHAARQRKYAERLKRHNAGDHSLCKFCKPDASADASPDASTDATPSRSDTTRKGSRGKGKGTGSRPSRLEGAPALTRGQAWDAAFKSAAYLTVKAPQGTKGWREQLDRLDAAAEAEGFRKDRQTDYQGWVDDGGMDRFIKAERARLSNPTERA